MLRHGETIELRMTALGSSGEGIGDINGFKVFVEGALPQETVFVQVNEVKKNYATAKLLDIHTPSPERAIPPCPYYDRCGGCQLMHLSYPGQLAMKRQRVADAFRRIGRFDNLTIAPCAPSPTPLHYRNKIQLPIVPGKEGSSIGLYARHSHDLVPIDHCLIHCEIGEKVYSRVRPLIIQSGIPPYDERERTGTLRHLLVKSAIGTEEVLIVLITTGQQEPQIRKLALEIMSSCPEVKGVVENINTRHDNVIMGRTFRTLSGQPFITETLCGKTFKMSPPSFFQVNPRQAERLYQKALELAEIDKTKTVLDAFCGVGTLAIIAEEQAAEVLGIECVAEAIADARENSALNNASRCQFRCGKAEEIVPSLKTFDITLLNPPRKGCEPKLLECLNSPLIVYVSCDPATLARDAALLAARGYQIDGVFPFDMFPQTAHVETVARFRRSAR